MSYEWNRYEDYTEEFDKMYDLVKRVMEVREPTRNDDLELEDFVWNNVQEIDWEDRQDRKKRLKSSSLKRRRQEVQNDGECLPTEPQVLFDREFSPEEVADCYGISKPRLVNEYMKYLIERVKDGEITIPQLEERFDTDLDQLKDATEEEG